MEPLAQGDGPRWLYRYGSQIYGPISEDRLIQEVILGEVPSDIEVAKDGKEFFPITQIAVFNECLAQAILHRKEEKESRYKNLGRIAVLLAIAGLAWSGLALQHAIVLEEDKHASALEDAKVEMAKRLASIQALDPIKLTPVPQKDESVSKNKKDSEAKATRRPGIKKRVKKRSKSRAPKMVASCERSQKSIINGVKKHLRKINACIASEQRKNGKGALGQILVVGFLVRPTGRVLGFEIQDRVAATTGLRNCLTRVFRGIRFPRVGGTNCPVTLPIKLKTD